MVVTKSRGQTGKGGSCPSQTTGRLACFCTVILTHASTSSLHWSN